ncbi:MAG: hypothetical protein NTW96_20340 [Planctomycetia bacterium]|nr:hypothetical protein [Planctomycetia bacterium]
MSGIWSVGSSSLSSYLSELAAVRTRSSETDRQAEMEAQLDQSLASAGVSEETREAIEADLAAAFEEQMASGSFPPDPEEMKATIDGIFEKYGLNARDFMRPPASPAGHDTSARGTSETETESTGSTEDDLLKQLLEYLKEQRANSDEEDASTQAADMAQQVLDVLFGFDQEA